MVWLAARHPSNQPGNLDRPWAFPARRVPRGHVVTSCQCCTSAATATELHLHLDYLLLRQSADPCHSQLETSSPLFSKSLILHLDTAGAHRRLDFKLGSLVVSEVAEIDPILPANRLELPPQRNSSPTAAQADRILLQHLLFRHLPTTRGATRVSWAGLHRPGSGWAGRGWAGLQASDLTGLGVSARLFGECSRDDAEKKPVSSKCPSHSI